MLMIDTITYNKSQETQGITLLCIRDDSWKTIRNELYSYCMEQRENMKQPVSQADT